VKRSETRRPWLQGIKKGSTESAKYHVNYSALSELHGHCARLPGATRLTLFGACPWLSYSAPLALSGFRFRALGAVRFQIARLWRCQVSDCAPLALSGFRLRAFGAVRFYIPRPWRCQVSYSAPLALSSELLCKVLTVNCAQ